MPIALTAMPSNAMTTAFTEAKATASELSGSSRILL